MEGVGYGGQVDGVSGSGSLGMANGDFSGKKMGCIEFEGVGYWGGRRGEAVPPFPAPLNLPIPPTCCGCFPVATVPMIGSGCLLPGSWLWETGLKFCEIFIIV